MSMTLCQAPAQRNPKKSQNVDARFMLKHSRHAEVARRHTLSQCSQPHTSRCSPSVSDTIGRSNVLQCVQLRRTAVSHATAVLRASRIGVCRSTVRTTGETPETLVRSGGGDVDTCVFEIL